MYPPDCRAQVGGDFGEAALRDLARIIGRAYPETHRSSHERFVRSVARDHYPMERRSAIEDAMVKLADRHPHIRAIETQTKRDSYGYVRLVSNRSVLTQSKTDGPLCLPRDAEFRGTWARSPQLALFGDLAPAESEGDAVYGVVVHGPDERNLARVGFIRILIPDASGKHVLDHLDLWPYWDDDQERVEFPSTPIMPAAPKLRHVPRTAEESGA